MTKIKTRLITHTLFHINEHINIYLERMKYGLKGAGNNVGSAQLLWTTAVNS